ncbi:MAG: tRNA epoxyqueuosine(34) reductase QueG [Thermomicrobiales bacterium]
MNGPAPTAPSQPLLQIAKPDPRASFTARVKLLAAECGLAVSAITSAEPFDGLAERVSAHIDAGHLDGLDWYTKERGQIASDVRNLHPTAQSILSVGINYWPGATEKPDDGIARGRISRYAWGRDYHRVIKRRLKLLHTRLEEHVGHPVEARTLVDTARIVERAVAARSGLGWFGKNACIISPGFGSWLLLGELIVDLDLVPDEPIDKHCGRCTFCLDRCPTGAIVAPFTIDAPRCISFLTIEERGPIPHDLRPKMGDWVYGCDVCQEVCPYTGNATIANDPDLMPASLDNAWPSLHWLLRMTEEEFGATYFGTPVPRTKRRGLARNAAIAIGNTGTDEDISVLIEVLETHDEPLVRGHAAWALGRLGGRTARLALERARTGDPDETVRAEVDCAWEMPTRTV